MTTTMTTTTMTTTMTMTTMTTLDAKIAIARNELLKLREAIIVEGEMNQKKIDELKKRKAMLEQKQREVLDQGLDISVYADIMRQANEKDKTPYNSIAFGHQVLLLNTVHLMECREMAVRTSAKQGKKLVKFVERRKRALIEQNANHELLFANQLGQQYEKMKELEEEYRRVLESQQKAFWKIQSTAFPMFDLQPPTLSATTTEFLKNTTHFIGKTHNTSSSADRDRRTARREASMRNLMAIEGGLLQPWTTRGDVPRHIESAQNSISNELSTDSFPNEIEFKMSINDIHADGTPKDSPKKGRRLKRADSIDTISTAGEELLNTIQGYFFGGGRDIKNHMHRSDHLKLDESDRDWASMHGRERRRSDTANDSAALVV